MTPATARLLPPTASKQSPASSTRRSSKHLRFWEKKFKVKQTHSPPQGKYCVIVDVARTD